MFFLLFLILLFSHTHYAREPCVVPGGNCTNASNCCQGSMPMLCDASSSKCVLCPAINMTCTTDSQCCPRAPIAIKSYCDHGLAICQKCLRRGDNCSVNPTQSCCGYSAHQTPLDCGLDGLCTENTTAPSRRRRK